MQALSEIAWGVFRLDEEFECAKGVYLPTATVVDGDIPFITAKDGRNGVSRYIGNGALFDGNRITIEKIHLSSYYQPAPFYCSHDVSVISNDNLNEDNAQFVAEMIMRNGSKYSYGRQAQLNVVKRERIILPVNDDGEPDYAYMASFANEIGGGLLMRYKSFLAERIGDLKHVDVPALDEKEWCEFDLSALFTIGSGKRLETRNKVAGNRPFIGASENGNGVTGFVGNDNASKDSNVLGVNYNGAPCVAFYHPYECIFSDDVKRLHLHDYENNEFVLLFLAVIVRQQKIKYSYGYKFNEQRMKRQKLMVPIDDAGGPDYPYMEQYAMNMVLAKYEQYLSFLNRKGIS